MNGTWMRTIIFNVEHGFCAFIRSPNGYGLLCDCGNRKRFSPIKYIRKHYNPGENNLTYSKKRRFAEFVVSHPHEDHLSDLYALTTKDEDKPRLLYRSKDWNEHLKKKIEMVSTKDSGDKVRVEILKEYHKFQKKYDVKSEHPEYGFDFFKIFSLSKDDAWDVSSDDVDKYFNNSSNIIVIGFSGKKILIPGDIEVEGWKKLLENEKYKEYLKDINFFVTSHHGHKSGFTSDIIEVTGKPELFIVSARSGDEDVDSSYSNKAYSKGFILEGDSVPSRMVSTRERNGAIVIDIYNDERVKVYIENTADNISKDQMSTVKKKAARALR